MATTIVHFNNARRYRRPVLVWCGGCQELQPVEPTGTDAFGPFYEIEVESEQFEFTFRDGVFGDPDVSALQRSFAPPPEANAPVEIWCQSGNPFVYQVCPRQPDRRHASEYLRTLRFKEGVYVPGSGGLSGLGATVLADAGVLFGLYHPTAARVYVMGDFNDWNGPDGDPEKVVELRRYRGWFNTANTWLTVVDKAKAGDEYQFVVVGGVPSNGGTSTMEVTDPYARVLGETRSGLCAAVVDPTEYEWRDQGWQTPLPSDLIVYELSVYGLTAGLDDLPDRRKGRFSGVVELMKDGYFEDLGINLLALMPITEVPSQQGPESLGYNPILPMTVERDLGTPEGLRAMVDAAHGHGLAIILDKVFNHTSNRANLLWQTVLEHPDEEARNEGGLYFAGETPWGNRTALHKEDVQNLFIDACKMWLQEYHVDGFRFDATSTMYMDHGFVIRLARELQAFRPGVILVAENLPNESDLNLEGYNGIMQWSCLFHHKMKALLREGQYLDWHADELDDLGDIYYFCKGTWAAHTNNVLNYTWSHDEHSPVHEIRSQDHLDHPEAHDQKGRLALFATTVALGQPMYFMGQEFNLDRPRNVAWMDWPEDLENHGFYQWARRVIRMRRRYPGLRLDSYDPAADGLFTWLLGPWLPACQGEGRRLLGWRITPSEDAHETMVILLSFESEPVVVDIQFGLPGTWVCLADLDRANDLPPEGDNSAADPRAIHSKDGWFRGFTLPPSSGFLYKWETA